MNNRTLIIIFIAALLIFLGIKMLRKAPGASFDPILSSVDTTKVDRIYFSSGVNDEFALVKAGTTPIYRDNAIIKFEVNDLTKIEWSNGDGRQEAISKEDGIWHYAGMEAVDATRMQTYLLGLVNTKRNGV